jgi:hypothetical protein
LSGELVGLRGATGRHQEPLAQLGFEIGEHASVGDDRFEKLRRGASVRGEAGLVISLLVVGVGHGAARLLFAGGQMIHRRTD